MYYSKDEKAKWLEDWKQSGKKAWTYAKENGLAPQTFLKWTKAEAATQPRFVEVPVQTIRPSRQTPEILIEKGDVKIHIPPGLSNDELRTVIEGLKCLP